MSDHHIEIPACSQRRIVYSSVSLDSRQLESSVWILFVFKSILLTMVSINSRKVLTNLTGQTCPFFPESTVLT